MKTCPCKVYPLKPHFYIVKLGYAGVYLFFLFLLQNIDCGYLLELPRQGGSNVYPQTMCCAKIRKISKLFLSKLLIFDLKKLLYIIWACFCNVTAQKYACLHNLFEISRQTSPIENWYSSWVYRIVKRRFSCIRLGVNCDSIFCFTYFE